MESRLGIVLVLMLAAVSSAQDCTCATNKRTTCAPDRSGICVCRLIASAWVANCSTLTSKCLLMKTEMTPSKVRRVPSHGFLDNDGIYDPDCAASGAFKAKQCNGTDTCWCVNSAGVRRTDKGERTKLNCSELVRTNHIFIELKHKKRSDPFVNSEVANALRYTIQNRYKLHPNYIGDIDYEYPFISINLKQNASQKLNSDVDIADVAYYFEKDVKRDSIFHSSNPFSLSVGGKPLDVEEMLIYYVDEKPPEFSMKQLTPGVIAVVVFVILSLFIGITVLVITRRRRIGKYKKVEIKEMGEMRRGQNV
ncbi:PREDICTED: tumor-associated calcium signal transducer 2 [Gavialis gangeticus]|uniref:tumor-associated calcium signal transducer 2 n=1 Tax=Gavialis gangeticus TaxID=94835 RepID=UPI00092FD480|nr:PREDICTED: tumor-associated calcium signal transducer 2 [Gavialis gangeticus]